MNNRFWLEKKRFVGQDSLPGWIYHITGTSIIISGRQQRSYRPYAGSRRCGVQVACQPCLILHNGIA